MQITRQEIDAWIQANQGAKKPWPKQNTFRRLLEQGALYRFEHEPHVLCALEQEDGRKASAHLFTSSSLLNEGLSLEEQEWVRGLVDSWKPRFVWVAWMLTDRTMQGQHEVLTQTSGLLNVSKKIRYWSVSGVTRIQFEALLRP
ncbi:MAG: hypothetical protein H6727_07280 [Myxococcales bacterium]|nr:hypothetical protein [Myxococcales bacterium]